MLESLPSVMQSFLAMQNYGLFLLPNALHYEHMFTIFVGPQVLQFLQQDKWATGIFREYKVSSDILNGKGSWTGDFMAVYIAWVQELILEEHTSGLRECVAVTIRSCTGDHTG